MTVDEYLDDLPEADRKVLEGIRDTIRKAAPDAEELISYRIPLYKLNGQHMLAFAGGKKHLSLYVMNSGVLDEHAEELARFDTGDTKTTVRFTVDDPIPRQLVRKIVKTRIKEITDG